MRIVKIFTSSRTCTWLYLISAWAFSFFKNALRVFIRKLILTLVYILLLPHSLLIKKHLVVMVLMQIKRLIFKISRFNNFVILWKWQIIIILKSWFLRFAYWRCLLWFSLLSQGQYFVLLRSILLGAIYIWMATSTCIRIYYLIILLLFIVYCFLFIYLLFRSLLFILKFLKIQLDFFFYCFLFILKY